MATNGGRGTDPEVDRVRRGDGRNRGSLPADVDNRDCFEFTANTRAFFALAGRKATVFRLGYPLNN